MKRAILILLVIMSIGVLLSACGASGDETDDPVVAVVDGAEIRRSEVEALAVHGDEMYNSVSELSEAEIAEKKLNARLEILDMLVREQVIAAKVAEYGISETESMLTAAEERWSSTISLMEDYVLASYPTLEGDELEDTVASMLTVQNVSEEALKASVIKDELEKALQAEVVAMAPMPEEAELRAYYDDLLEEQTALFSDDISAFERELMSDELVLYRPVEVRAVQQLYLKFDEDVIDLMKQLESVGDNATKDEMRQDQLIIINETLESVLTRLESGEDFRILLSEYDADSAEDINYITAESSRFSEEYMAALFAIDEQGGHSVALEQEYGYIILKWDHSLEPATVSYEEVAESIVSVVMDATAEAYYEEQVNVWLSEAEVELYTDNLSVPIQSE